MAWDYHWPSYVSVADMKEAVAKEVAKLRKTGRKINPVTIQGRQITNTF